MTIDYSNGKIYKLVNDFDNEIYVGSTCQRLSKRKSEHFAFSKIRQNRKVYEHLNKIGWKNVRIILIENFVCKNKEQLNARERYYIDTLKATLNSNIPTRSKKEYYDTHRMEKQFTDKAYREKNKEEIMKQKHEYYLANKERVKQKSHERYLANKDTIHKQGKEYRNKNKEEIKLKQKEYRENTKKKANEKRVNGIWLIRK